MCFCQQKENVSFRPDLIAAIAGEPNPQNRLRLQTTRGISRELRRGQALRRSGGGHPGLRHTFFEPFCGCITTRRREASMKPRPSTSAPPRRATPRCKAPTSCWPREPSASTAARCQASRTK